MIFTYALREDIHELLRAKFAIKELARDQDRKLVNNATLIANYTDIDNARELKDAVGEGTQIIFLAESIEQTELLDLLRLKIEDLYLMPVEHDKLFEHLSRMEPSPRLNLSNYLKLADREFLTTNPQIKALLIDALKVAKYDISVLICGESGTGKEILARYIHANSPRREGPFIGINCGAIPEGLMETELFGHEPGAFTGAEGLKIGIFERASGGTIFLDEIGDMPTHLQVKLLRVLQEGEITRVGGDKSIPVAPRILAATNKDLEKLITNNKFREDLFYRVSVVKFDLIPLRDRSDDILYLANFFLQYFRDKWGKALRFTQKSEEALMAYHWPGNIRELKNFIERASVLCDDAITPEHLGLEHVELLRGFELGMTSLKEVTTLAARKLELKLISQMLQSSGGNRALAAKRLGISPKVLQEKLRS